MLLDEETLRFIFGFKLRGLRQEKDLSLKSLAQATGLSPSYINEIEKGKKYPKGDKILLLSRALGVSYDELTSIKLKKELSIIAQILGNNMIRGMPFDIFGIPARTLFELMAEQPQNFSTLVGTILELARNYNVKVEDFFNATLRAFLDMSNNYFPELEKAASSFRKELGLGDAGTPTVEGLSAYLTSKQGYRIRDLEASESDPALRDLFFHAAATEGGTRLLLNPALSEKERLFILARECGYARLGAVDRPRSNLMASPDSFDAVRNGFRAAYFASAFLIPRETFIAELESFLALPKWDAKRFLSWVTGASAPASAVFHRAAQILPEHFGLEQMFFLRFDYEPKSRRFHLLRELHLSELHAPHDMKSRGHYCQRWITTSLLEGLAASSDACRVGIQRSKYYGTDKEYLCFSMAYRKELGAPEVECVTIGVRVTDELRKRVAFAEDPAVPRKVVSDACESCGVEDCAERAAPPTQLIARAKEKALDQALEKLQSTV